MLYTILIIKNTYFFLIKCSIIISLLELQVYLLTIFKIEPYKIYIGN